MRIFITGGTGFIGSAVVRELLDAGHEVVGLARSEVSAQSLTKAGALVHIGSLEDTESLKRGAASSDAVVHTAFVHDFSDFGASVETDRRAIEAMGETLVGSGRRFVVTSGVPTGKDGRAVTEADDSDPKEFPRLSEAAALPFAKRNVNVSIVRPSRFVYGEGGHGFIALLIDIARKTGASAYVGNGQNRCHAVHRLDAAGLFRLALEKGKAGARYQAVGDEGVAFRDIAEAIGKHLNIPVVSIPAEEAAERFGFLGSIVRADNPASSEITRKALGWRPTQPSLLQDLSSDRYFA